MPRTWLIDAGGNRIRIVRRADHVDGGEVESPSRMASLVPRIAASPILVDLYRSLGYEADRPQDLHSGEFMRRTLVPRLQKAFYQGDLVGVRLSSGRAAGTGSEEAASTPTTIAESKRTVEMVVRKPVAGEVYLVGDRVPIEAVVIENGQETDADVALSGSGGVVERGAYVLTQGGRHILVAENTELGVKTEVQFSAVSPSIVAVEAEAVYEVYDVKSKGPKKGHLEKGIIVPFVAKMGSSFSLTVFLEAFKPLTRPMEVEIACVSPEPLNDRKTEFAERPFANQPMIWSSIATLQHLNRERLELQPKRPIPKRICRFLWKKPWYYRIKGVDGSWSHPAKDPREWMPLQGPEEFFLYAVWASPRMRGSYPLDPWQYDHFHIDKACLWAEGAFDLKLCGERSIPYKVDNRMGHYRWPGDYRFFNGEDPPGENWKPVNYVQLPLHPQLIHYPHDGDADWPRPGAEGNWGWKVLDNPKGAGGRCDQQASLLAAILNTLGIDAKPRTLTSRWGTNGEGLFTNGNHDPVTMRCPCHKPGQDTEWNFHGVCVVNTEGAEPEETAYDGSFSSPYTKALWPPSPCAEDHLSGLIQGRKHCYKSQVALTSHDRRPWAERKGKCRCGHHMPDKAKSCPTCGAQPAFRYRCTRCEEGRLEIQDEKCPRCNSRLKGIFADALIAPCPKCGKTVHDEMTACWACGTRLPDMEHLSF